MNARQRVIAALNHNEPDKVPIDFGGTLATTITRVAYNNLRNFLNLNEENPIIAELICDTVRISEDILLLYEIDTIPVYVKDASLSDPKYKLPYSFEDAYGVKWRRASYYYDAVDRPLKEGTINELKNAKWENYSDKSIVKGLREEAKWIYDNTDYCLIADIPCLGPFEGGCILRGYDNFLIDLHINSKFAEALLDKLTETAMAKWTILLDEIGDYIQVAAQGDDLGIQLSPYVSPEMYKKIIKPYHKKIFDLIHSKTKAKIFLHSCGSVYDLIPDFIEVGVDILNPIQRFAAKMDINKLKTEFGKDICFWGGGIDIQQQLPFYSLEEIEYEVKKSLDILAPNGGYVFFPTHNIQADVAAEKIDCLFKSFIKFRNY